MVSIISIATLHAVYSQELEGNEADSVPPNVMVSMLPCYWNVKVRTCDSAPINKPISESGQWANL